MRRAKFFPVFIFLSLFLGMSMLEVWLHVTERGFSVMEFIYWILFLLWLSFIISLKTKSASTLFLAFSLFILAAIFTVLGLVEVGEILMRMSLIGWMIGLGQSIFGIKNAKDK